MAALRTVGSDAARVAEMTPWDPAILGAHQRGDGRDHEHVTDACPVIGANLLNGCFVSRGRLIESIV